MIVLNQVVGTPEAQKIHVHWHWTLEMFLGKLWTYLMPQGLRWPRNWQLNKIHKASFGLSDRGVLCDSASAFHTVTNEDDVILPPVHLILKGLMRPGNDLI
jgi:hypothetical protein